MRQILNLCLIASLMVFVVSCDSKHSHEDTTSEESSVYYTCAMHPEIKEDGPGRCPICHMALTRVEEDHDHSEQSSAEEEKLVFWQCENFPDVQSSRPGPCPLDGTEMIKVDMRETPGEIVANVRLRQSQLDHFSPSFFRVTPMKMQKSVRLLGTVLQAEERESNIPARVEGRVEKVYISSSGAHVRQGDPLVDFYSPKLISAGEEYLIAKRNYNNRQTESFKSLLHQSEERLRLWGIQREQFERWAKAQEVPEHITLYSPVNGIVVNRNATMGRYFNEGESLFDLVDLGSVWLEIDVYEVDSGLIEMGQDVDISFNALPGEKWSGQIDFIDPVISRESRTLKVRTTLDNSKGNLRPGMIAEAVLNIDLGESDLVIPRSALIDTGRRQVVWTRDGERSYRAKLIRTGHDAGGYVQVLAGLEEDEEIVLEGNFLLDAQAQIFGGYEKFRGEGEASSADPHAHH